MNNFGAQNQFTQNYNRQQNFGQNQQSRTGYPQRQPVFQQQENFLNYDDQQRQQRQNPNFTRGPNQRMAQTSGGYSKQSNSYGQGPYVQPFNIENQYEPQELSQEDQLMYQVMLMFQEKPLKQFFDSYDASIDRKFEYWELMCMFRLSNSDARLMINIVSGDKERVYLQFAKLKDFCDKLKDRNLQGRLYNLGYQVDYMVQQQIQEINVTSDFSNQSQYKNKQLDPRLLMQIKQFVQKIKEKVFGQSGTFMETFKLILQAEKDKNLVLTCQLETFQEFFLNNNLCQQYGIFQDRQELKIFIDYLKLGRDNYINAIQFIRGMSCIEPDIEVIPDCAKEMDKIIELRKADSNVDQSLIFRLKVLYNNLDAQKIFKLKEQPQNLEYYKGGEKTVHTGIVAPISNLNHLLTNIMSNNFDLDEQISILEQYKVFLVQKKEAPQPILNMFVKKDQAPTTKQETKAPVILDNSLNKDDLEGSRQKQNATPISDKNKEIQARSVNNTTPIPDDDLNQRVETEKKVTEENRVIKEDEYEEYEGGSQERLQGDPNMVGWFNLQQFEEDMSKNATPQLVYTYPTFIMHYVFDMWTKYIIITGKKMSDLFRIADKKGIKMMSIQELKRMMGEIYMQVRKSKFVPQLVIDALVRMFMRVSDNPSQPIDYCVMYTCYLDYVNHFSNDAMLLQQTQLDVSQMVQSMKDFIQMKKKQEKNFSFLKFFKLQIQYEDDLKQLNSSKLQSRNNLAPNLKVKKEDFFTLVHVTIRKKPIQGRERDDLVKKINRGAQDLDIDLIKLVETLGVQREDDVVFSTKLRSICHTIQLNQLSFQTIQEQIPMNPTIQTFVREIQRVCGLDKAKTNQLILTMAQGFKESGNNVNRTKALGHLQKEMNKLTYLERFYLILDKELQHEQNSFNMYDYLDQWIRKTKRKQFKEETNQIVTQQAKKELEAKFQIYLGEKKSNLEVIEVSLFKMLLEELNIASVNKICKNCRTQQELTGETQVCLDKKNDKNQLHTEKEPSPEMQYFLDEYLESEDQQYIKIESIVQDYNELIAQPQSYLEQLEMSFMTKIAEGMLVQQQSIIQALALAQQKAGSKSETLQTMWMHSYTFSTWLKELLLSQQQFQGSEIDLDSFNLFVLLLSEGGKDEKKDMIYLPNFFKKFSAVTNIQQDQNLLNFQIEEALKNMKNLIVYRLQRWGSKEISPQQYFLERFLSEQEINLKFTREPILFDTMGLQVELSEMLNYYRDPNSGQINLQRLCQELDEVIEQQKKKQKLFTTINRKMEQNATTIENYFMRMYGTQSKQQDVSMSDFKYMCLEYYNKNLDKNEAEVQLITAVYKSLTTDHFGEVTVNQFLKEFKEAQPKRKVGALDVAGQEIIQSVVQAKRFQQNWEESLKIVGQTLVKRQMLSFGSYLKGYDFKNQSQIKRQDFYLIFEQLFGDELGSGDVLDLIEHYDHLDSGTINIETVASDLDMQIYNQGGNFRLNLFSKVSDIARCNIVEPTTPREIQSNEPKDFSYMLLDLLTALFCQIKLTHDQSKSDIQNVLDYFYSFIGDDEISKQQNLIEISMDQMEAAWNSLKVTGSKQQKKEVLLYVKKEVDKARQQKIDNFKLQETIHWLLNSHKSIYFDQTRLSDQLMIKVAKQCSDLMLPVLDLIQNYEEKQWQMMSTDFLPLIQGDFKMSKVLTKNMINFLQYNYNERNLKIMNIEKFYKELKIIEMRSQQESNEPFKIFDKQADVDSYMKFMKQDRRNHQIIEQYVAPKQEPRYYSRTDKNTYSSNTHSFNNLDKNIINEIVLQTRSKGKCVEEFFKNEKYGQFSPEDGIRYVDNKGFVQAVVDLGSRVNRNYVTKIFDNTCAQYSCQKLTLSQIGDMVFSVSNCSIVEREAETIEQIYEAVHQMKLSDNLHKIFDFLNASRDCKVTSEDFTKFLADHLGLKGSLKRQNIEFLVWRYRSLKSDNLIYFYKFIKDMNYQRLKIGLKDQKAAQLAETLVKAFYAHSVIKDRKYLQDKNLAAELQRLIRDRSGDPINMDEFLHLMQFLDIQRLFDLKKVSDFYAFSEEIKLNQRGWRSNSVDVAKIKPPFAIMIDQVINAITWLCQKPLAMLFQEVLDQVYISSKARNVHIQGPYIIHIFDKHDIRKSGFVTLEQFIEIITKELMAGHEDEHDQFETYKNLQFLAMKYYKGDKSSKQEVNYFEFFEDYNRVENQGIGGTFQSTIVVKERSSTYLKAIHDQSQSVQKAYQVLGDHLIKHKKDLNFISMLCGYDDEKNAYLKKDTIQVCLQQIAPRIQTKQTELLLEPLSLDQQERLNYAEMLFMLFGSEVLQKIMKDFKIVTIPVAPEIDSNEDQEPLSQGLVDQLELRYSLIVSKLNQYGVVRDQDVFKILIQECGTVVTNDDLEILKVYIRKARDQQRFTINMLEMMNKFGISRQSDSIIQMINQHLKKIPAALQCEALTPEVNFKDFQNFLSKVNFDYESLKESELDKLFKQMCMRQSMISRAKFFSFFHTPQQIDVFLQKVVQLKKQAIIEGDLIGRYQMGQLLLEITNDLDEIKLICDYFSHKQDQVDALIIQRALMQTKVIQKTNQQTADKIDVLNLPSDIKLTVKKLAVQMTQYKYQIEQIFKEIDTNKDNKITVEEFESFLKKRGYHVEIPKESIHRIFRYLDYKNDSYLSLSQLSQLFKNQLDIYNQCQMPQELIRELRDEAKEVFLKYSQGSSEIKLEDVMKYFNVHDQSVDLEQLQRIDVNSDNKIPYKDFESYVLANQKKRLLLIDTQLDHLRGLLQQLQPINSSAFLKLVVRLSKANINKIDLAASQFEKIDVNGNGVIDEQEMMNWLYSADGHESIIVMNIRKACLAKHDLTVLSLFNDQPGIFVKSIVQQKIDDHLHTPSQGLQPAFNFYDRQFFGNCESQPKLYAFEIALTDTNSIPNPKNCTGQVEIRMYLFDTLSKTVESSVHVIRCQLKSPQATSSKWVIDESLKSICVRSNQNVQLVFEFVHFTNSYQIMVGWAKLDLNAAQSKQNHKLTLLGQSPYQKQEIVQQIAEQDESVGGKIAKAFGSKTKIERYVEVQIRPFSKLVEQVKKDFYVMPENSICAKNLLSFAAAFRRYAYKSDELNSKVVDVVLSQFSKVYDNSDIQAILATLWPAISQNPDESMQKVVKKIYVALHQKEFVYNFSNFSSGDQLFQTRKQIIQQTLQNKESNPAPGLVLMEELQPFSIQELNNVLKV